VGRNDPNIVCTYEYNKKRKKKKRIPIIPATQEAEAGGSQPKAGLDKTIETYLKNKLKNKTNGAWLKC
jgi:hypothetical protein